MFDKRNIEIKFCLNQFGKDNFIKLNQYLFYRLQIMLELDGITVLMLQVIESCIVVISRLHLMWEVCLIPIKKIFQFRHQKFVNLLKDYYGCVICKQIGVTKGKMFVLSCQFLLLCQIRKRDVGFICLCAKGNDDYWCYIRSMKEGMVRTCLGKYYKL